MNVTETILRRRSVRTFTGKPLDGETIQKIRNHIAGLQAPLGAVCRIELISTTALTEPVKLGTYGAIRGATDYLALIIRDDTSPAQEGAAYIFEQTVLYCTSLGLGTCWLAGFFDRGGFKKQLSLQPGEKLRSVSPVGYAAEVPHRSISTLMNGGKPTPRKPFPENFFLEEFGRPLSESAAGVYAQPLEMVRRAPSANNKQPWRVVMEGDTLHFYKAPSMGYESLDLGIALCHFVETCIEKGIAGRLEVRTNVPKGRKATYVVSWAGRLRH